MILHKKAKITKKSKLFQKEETSIVIVHRYCYTISMVVRHGKLAVLNTSVLGIICEGSFGKPANIR